MTCNELRTSIYSPETILAEITNHLNSCEGCLVWFHGERRRKVQELGRLRESQRLHREFVCNDPGSS